MCYVWVYPESVYIRIEVTYMSHKLTRLSIRLSTYPTTTHPQALTHFPMVGGGRILFV